MPSSPVLVIPPKRRKKEGKKQRKFGRKYRNGKPFGMHGGCGCETCRVRR